MKSLRRRWPNLPLCAALLVSAASVSVSFAQQPKLIHYHGLSSDGGANYPDKVVLNLSYITDANHPFDGMVIQIAAGNGFMDPTSTYASYTYQQFKDAYV